MKKKLLSLVLAGAMVASTSVSAFASGVTQEESATAPTTAPTHVGNGEINGSDNKEYTTDVIITGTALNDQGTPAVGTFNVTVPTTASFTVSKGKNVISEPITIQNNGPQNIDVYAEKFVDITPGEGKQITVTKGSDLKQKNRSYVSLSLEGKGGRVYLKTENTNTGSEKGVYKDTELQQAATGQDLRLTTISKQESGKITLNGNAGDLQLAGDSVSDKFTLTLKIKKSENQ